MSTNNEYLIGIAGEDKDSGLTNNQLLEKILAKGNGNGTSNRLRVLLEDYVVEDYQELRTLDAGHCVGQ